VNILLIGDITGNLDEGMKNTTFNLKRVLEKHHEVMVMHPRQAIRLETLKKIRSFKPAIIHYVHGPTFRSFVVTKLLSILNVDALAVMSVPKPTIGSITKFFLPILKPNSFLLQSKRNANLFKASAFSVYYFSPGVNLEKFHPVSVSRRKILRTKYGVPAKKFIILHVGHISKQRNLNVLSNIQRLHSDILQVLIVGALTIKPDKHILRKLIDSGCTVWIKYFENLEEIYQLADCYLFPGMYESSAVEIPLSILEAMACNLPVITDRFGGLPDLFHEGDGLYFAVNEDDMCRVLVNICQSRQDVKTRKKVENFSWENAASRLVKLYEKQLCK